MLTHGARAVPRQRIGDISRMDGLDRRPACTAFEGMKIFSATKARDRERLGESVTGWMNKNPHLEVVNYNISQSSDTEFHCVTVAIFWVHRRVQA